MTKVIFDLYGTLIHLHTDETKKEFWKKFAKKMNKYQKYNPKELRKLYLMYCANLQKEKEEIELLDVFKLLYPSCDAAAAAILFRRLSTRNISLYPGVRRLLKYLKINGCEIYLLSNAQSSFTNYELNKLDIKRYFNGIYLSSDKGIKKPNINFIKALCNEYNISYDEAYMIGNDYICDIAPAQSLGIKTIYIETNESRKIQTKYKIVGFNYEKIRNKLKFS